MNVFATSFLLIWVVSGTWAAADPCPEKAEADSAPVIRIPELALGTNLRWAIEILGDIAHIAQCSLQDLTCTSSEGYHATLETNGETYVGYLAIVKDQRSTETFKWYDGEFELGECVLTIADSNGPSMIVTSFTADAASTVLNVTAGTSVSLVCDAQGDSRPQVKVKGQRSNMTLPLTTTEVGDNGVSGEGEITMYCNTTDTFVCTPNIGAKTGTPKKVTVNAECEPELKEASVIDHSYYSIFEGKTLEVRFVINSYPPPDRFDLFQTGNLTEPSRKKREARRDMVSRDIYQTSYIPLQPPQGVVVVNMHGWGKGNSGQYVLNVQNGIGNGLDITFSVNVKKEEDDDGMDIHAIIGSVCGVIGAIAAIAPGVYFCCNLPSCSDEAWNAETDHYKKKD